MEHQYLVMKLGYVDGVDFYKEHLKIINEHGYVDFVRLGKKLIEFDNIKESFFFIKESHKGGNRLFKAIMGKDVPGEKRIPEYYSKLRFRNASWVRIVKLEPIDKNEFLREYTLKNGNKIKALDHGMISYFFVIKSREKQ